MERIIKLQFERCTRSYVGHVKHSRRVLRVGPRQGHSHIGRRFDVQGPNHHHRCIFSSLHYPLSNMQQYPTIIRAQDDGTTAPSQWMTAANKSYTVQRTRRTNYSSSSISTKNESSNKEESTQHDIRRRLLPHDVGGDESLYGVIDPNNKENPPDDLLEWEQQCHALFAVLASKFIIRTDELRRTIEGLTFDEYSKLSYYEKWTSAMIKLLIQHKIIEQEELENTFFGFQLREETHAVVASSITTTPQQETTTPTTTVPLYKVGDMVRVKQYQPPVSSSGSMLYSSLEWRRPHIRTPGYIYGVAGEIERVCGRHGDPSLLAFGLEAPMVQLYRVRFRQKDIWPEQQQQQQNSSKTTEGNNTGSPEDVVEVEIYEHWLQPASTREGHSYEDTPLFDHSPSPNTTTTTTADDDHGHHHHHDHDEADENHIHESRDLLETRVAILEGPPKTGEALFRALRKLLVSKDVISTSELRSMMENMDSAGKRLDGATLVARAWVDPEFQQLLLDNAPKAAKQLGIQTSNANAPTVLTVVQNTPTVHNLVVCTLCSCFPSSLLGIAPKWYKSREYRSRAVREPRVVLRDEFGLDLDDSKSIRVHDSTADHRYLVLPERPTGTEGWSEEDLRSLVSRDSMVGVAVATNRTTSEE